ncbi:MAG: NAD(P)H dehydrogenase, partial [Oscillochloris sp.]|nr:NAD(P)H dehydrogenase [Oscillochloris sp.]
MKALILNGSHADDTSAEMIATVLSDRLQSHSWEIEQILLREQKIGACAGDFFCWIRNPGMCNTNDDNRIIAAKVAQSDLVIWLTPVTFGGYSSALKRAVDHLIQNILPFFTHIHGEVHHQRRYTQYPNMLVIGWIDTPDAASEATFRHLVQRNALNMHARTTVCGIVTGSLTADTLATHIDGWLKALASGASSAVPALPMSAGKVMASDPVRRAVLLVGSPRTGKSSSAALGSYLLDQLAEHNVEIQTFQLYTTLNTPARWQTVLDSLDSADLIVLAFPLYVDSLPAPVIMALEKIAAHRAERHTTQRLVAISNCGFPEAQHCANALAVCARFAEQAGLVWAGGMALGAGEGVIHQTPLTKLGRQARLPRQALEIAAKA